ncbi:hypothetical protein [Engelhardtia mirabilis]|uniref:Uncharacterized protein n=1 Tax=Engelhardtia mirabilis TaxID=2528011 RepID=A0A518BMK1_9BACT|nr:hypothetical protein Pla133_33090 [Planctomycetes bacterium Pla133]QDV02540.1 hypothetical protein Pla86_33080 [Planctomycetes bacterium Pla86]
MNHFSRSKGTDGGSRALARVALSLALLVGAWVQEEPIAPAGASALLAGGRAVRVERAAIDGQIDGSTVVPVVAQLEALVLAAAPAPPGLTPSRRAERDAERSERLAELSELVVGAAGRSRRHILEGWLLSPELDPERWTATAAAVGELQLVGLAPSLAEVLDDPETSRRRAVARRALHAVYGVWFQSATEFMPFAELEAGPTLAGYRDTLLDGERRELELRRFRWQVEPSRAVGDLDADNPDVRRAAAAALRDLVRKGGGAGLEPEALAETLTGRLVREVDAIALCSQLELLIELLRDADPTDARVAAARDLLERGLRGGPVAILPCAAHSIASLPLAMGEADADSPVAMVAGALMDGVARCVGPMPVRDPDATVALLAALRRVTRDVGRDRLVALVGADALVEPVLQLAASSGRALSVTRAAAAALIDLAAPADLAQVARALVRPGQPIDVETLEVLTSLAATLEAGSPGLDLAARGALATLGDPSLDLRRRAITLLGLASIEPAIDDQGRGQLVARLGIEPIADLRLGLLDLIAHIGGPEQVDQVLGLSNLPLDDAMGEAIAALIEVRSPERADLRARGARRIAAIGSLRARTLALELLTSADDATAANYTSTDSDEAIRWGLELVDAGASLRAAGVLLERHLPRATGLTPLERARATALLGAAAGRAQELVEAQLAASLEELAADAERWRLRRDRARLRSDADRAIEAAQDWLEVVAGSDGGANLERLELTDARAALADLLVVLDGGGDGPRAGDANAATGASGAEGSSDVEPARGDAVHAAAVLAVDIGVDLLGRADWSPLPDEVRIADLDRLGRAALASKGPAVLLRAALALDNLTQATGFDGEGPPGTGDLTGPRAASPVIGHALALRQELLSTAQSRDPSPTPPVEAPAERSSEVDADRD